MTALVCWAALCQEPDPRPGVPSAGRKQVGQATRALEGRCLHEVVRSLF